MTEKDHQNEELEPEPKPDTKQTKKNGAHTIPVQMF